jgi:hypothetical protein
MEMDSDGVLAEIGNIDNILGKQPVVLVQFSSQTTNGVAYKSLFYC